jgi:hypothetical protein
LSRGRQSPVTWASILRAAAGSATAKRCLLCKLFSVFGWLAFDMAEVWGSSSHGPTIYFNNLNLAGPGSVSAIEFNTEAVRRWWRTLSDVPPRHSGPTLDAKVPELRQRSALSVPPMACQSAVTGGDRNQVHPYVPLSHPFVERLIGTLRREYLDQTLFWTTADLENKRLDFRTCFNNHRMHTSREGRTPDTPVSRPIANLHSFRWQPHCGGLYQTPMAA